MRWLLCTVRAPYHLESVREWSPLHTAAADVGLVSCEWECPSTHGSHWCGAGIMWMRGYPLHTAATDVGLVSCEWECPSTHGSRWCGAGIMWMRGYPLHTAATDVGLESCEWECPSTHDSRWCGAGIMWMRGNPLHTAATDVGLVSCEWECPSAHGSRWCGAGIMWMRGYPLHRADHCWGAGIVWIREHCLPDTAATDEGLVSCEWVRSQVIVLCTRQNAALRRGAASLDSGFVRAESAVTWEPIAPVSALGSPLRHGRGTWEARLMSCPAGSMGERNADIVSISSSPESLRSTTDRGQTDRLILKKKSYSPERCRGAALAWVNLNCEL